MSIKFSEHARQQLKRRNISENLVKKAVQNTKEILPNFRDRKLRRMKNGDKMLEVITRTEGSRITIITAYYLEE